MVYFENVWKRFVNKAKWIWIYGREKRQYSSIKDYKMPYKAIKRPYKALQDHTRPYKANTAIQYHNVPQKHIFSSPAQFLFYFEHFEKLQQ